MAIPYESVITVDTLINEITKSWNGNPPILEEITEDMPCIAIRLQELPVYYHFKIPETLSNTNWKCKEEMRQKKAEEGKGLAQHMSSSFN